MSIMKWLGIKDPFAKEPVPVPSKVLVESPSVSAGAYGELAKQAGFQGYETIAKRTAFRAFLADNGICVYEQERVFKYLRSHCPRDWYCAWVPVKQGFIFNGDFTWRPQLGPQYSYAKPIPDVVLMTMAKIRQQFGDAAEFYVSDFIDPKAAPFRGDPFLAVEYEDERFIIERWDEPGFRM